MSSSQTSGLAQAVSFIDHVKCQALTLRATEQLNNAQMEKLDGANSSQ
jgi:hypothetical protein